MPQLKIVIIIFIEYILLEEWTDYFESSTVDGATAVKKNPKSRHFKAGLQKKIFLFEDKLCLRIEIALRKLTSSLFLTNN